MPGRKAGHGHTGAQTETPAIALNPLMSVVRVEGKIGTQSLYASEAAGAVDAAVKMVSLDDAPQGDGNFSVT